MSAIRSGRRQTESRIRDLRNLREGASKPNVRAGARAPGTRQTETRMRDSKDLRKGACVPKVRAGARARGDWVRALGSQWQVKGPVGAREQAEVKGE